ncbi:hypothetical protein CsSME_00010116 [Camellia sinensis var. sinensis]
MASSKVMASTSPTNPDLPRQSSIHSLTVADLQCDQSKSFGSMNMDELLKNIYGDSDAFPSSAVNGGDTASLSRQASLTLPKTVGNKTVDEVWKEIVEGSGGGGANREPEMTLEDFLTKAGAVSEEDVRIPVISQAPAGFGADSMMNAAQFQAPPPLQNETGGYGVDSVGFGNGIDGRMVAVAGGGNGGGGGRGKRRTVEEPPMDKATQQKQRRMIKNRESAARSRERKQAYTVELESLVTQLEEENSRLLREEAEQSKERFKQHGELDSCCGEAKTTTSSSKSEFHVTGRCSLIYGLTIKMEETGFLSPVSEAELEGFLYKKKDRKKKKGMGPMFVFGGQLLV